MLGELWENIPPWVIFAIVGVALVGVFVLVKMLGWPMLTFWMLLGGVGSAVVIGLVRAVIIGVL